MSHTILRLPDVLRATGLSRSAVYEQIAKGDFPHQIKLTARSTGWLQSDVDAWIDQKIRESRTAA